MSRDTIYRAPGPATDFAFGPQVAGVFDDMVERSVPGYLMMQEYLVRTIDTLPNPPATVLDIGCATGTSMALLADRYPGIHLIGYDDSEPMLAKAEQRLAQLPSASFDLRADDVCEVREFPAADVVLLNLTLQFIRPLRRPQLLRRLADAVRPGGTLLLMEKFLDADPAANRRLIAMHHDFKRRQGYSDLEIARKREDIENVLIPLTVAENEELLRAAGFTEVALVLRVLNFGLLAAFRPDQPERR